MLDVWMREGDPARELVKLLKQDPVVARHAAAGTIMRLAPSLGFAADTWLWVLGYVREALAPGADAAEEARRLLRFLGRRGRCRQGANDSFRLGVEELVEFLFGRLLPGRQIYRSLIRPTSRPPRCSIVVTVWRG